MKVIVPIEVLEAAMRLLDPEIESYPGLVLAGSMESARRFHDDIILVAEAVGKLVTGTPQ
jgi:hypothetical protein